MNKYEEKTVISFHSFLAFQCTSTEGLQATCAAALELPNLNYEQGLN